MMTNSLNELFVEVTNYCLQSCVHCSSCAGPLVSEFIPLEDIKKLVNESVDLGLERFTISGGEPLLYPNLAELLKYLKTKNIKTSIYTCGAIKSLDGGVAPIDTKLMNILLENRPDKIIFSLQGGSAPVHERVTGVTGSFEVALNSIESVISNGFDVELHFVPMSINVADIEGVLSIADNLGINRVSVLRLVPQGRAIDDLVLSSEEGVRLKESIDFLREKYSSISIRLGAPFTCVNLSGNICSAAKHKLLISATGEIYPCEAFKSLRGDRPQIYDTHITEIWEKDDLLNKIRKLENDGVLNCTSCSSYSLCHGGCPGQRMLANGDLKVGPDPWCKFMMNN